jgi:hypothetical protein
VRAADLEKTVSVAEGRRARTLLELADVLIETGEIEVAHDRVVEARELATASGSLALAALAAGTLGVTEHHRTNRVAATQLYQDAARLAAEAGDGPAHERWKSAAKSMG